MGVQVYNPGPPIFPAVAFASLPTAGVAGRIYRVTDMANSLWQDNGTLWRPVNGVATLKTLDAQSATVANAATIKLQFQLPVNAWTIGDIIRFDFGMLKSGATDNGNMRAYVGTAGTTSDTQLFSLTTLSATGRQIGLVMDLRLEDATHVQVLASAASTFGYGGASSTTAYPASVAVTSAAANSLYVSIAILSSSTNDTVSMTQGHIYYLSSAS